MAEETVVNLASEEDKFDVVVNHVKEFCFGWKAMELHLDGGRAVRVS